MVLPEVIGVKLTGTLSPLTTATDLVLAITALLRDKDVVEKFVEFFGPGVASLSIADRATVANMVTFPEISITNRHLNMEQLWDISLWTLILLNISD